MCEKEPCLLFSLSWASISDVVLETAVSLRGSLELDFWNVSPRLGLDVQMSRSCLGLEVGKSRVNLLLFVF